MSAPEYTRWDSVEVRIWGRVNKSGPLPAYRPELGSCWLWTGRLDGKGYGERIGLSGRYLRAHSAVYTLEIGEVPDGMVLDHLCRVRSCVNPAHLEAVTPAENTQRGVEARWGEPCPNGHDPAGHRRTLPSGKTVCVECRRISDRARDARNKEARRAAGRARYAEKRAAA